MRSVYIIIAMLTIFSSCKKEKEPVDPCTNGFLDPGETNPDCGGNCPPCSEETQEYLTVQLNGEQTVMDYSSLFYDGSAWSLQISNDSISMQINLGNSGAIQTSNIPSSGTYCTMNSIDYPIQQNGTYSISEHNLSEHTMSGFFNIDFLLQISSMPLVYDTISFTGGQFEYFNY